MKFNSTTLMYRRCRGIRRIARSGAGRTRVVGGAISMSCRCFGRSPLAQLFRRRRGAINGIDYASNLPLPLGTATAPSTPTTRPRALLRKRVFRLYAGRNYTPITNLGDGRPQYWSSA
jgi:hypothetical protein